MGGFGVFPGLREQGMLDHFERVTGLVDSPFAEASAETELAYPGLQGLEQFHTRCGGHAFAATARENIIRGLR